MNRSAGSPSGGDLGNQPRFSGLGSARARAGLVLGSAPGRPGWSGLRGAARVPALSPAPPVHPMPLEEERCSGGGECLLSLVEKVTENVSPSGDRVRGFRERFPPCHPGALVEEGSQAQDDMAGGAW